MVFGGSLSLFLSSTVNVWMGGFLIDGARAARPKIGSQHVLGPKIFGLRGGTIPKNDPQRLDELIWFFEEAVECNFVTPILVGAFVLEKIFPEGFTTHALKM